MLDAGQATILIDPNDGTPSISADGMISQKGKQVGAVGLFSIPADAKLTRYDNSAIIPDQPATAVLDFSRNGVMQGFAEGSNVNPVLEITRMIEIQRAFDSLAGITQASEQSQQDAVKTLGGTS